MDTNKFSKFLKELRLERGLSQEQLAKELYVHRTTVNKWENDNVIPLNDKLISIANFFDVSIDELLNGKRNAKNIDTSPTSNTLIELIKSKSRSKKIILFLGICFLIAIIVFLLYYFVSTYNSVKVYMMYGENDTIKTKDGLLLFNSEKTYFKPGNFYDDKDKLIDVDLIRLYYYDDNNEEVIILTGSAKNLIIELEQSQESFMNIIKMNKDLYMDACYSKTCTKLKVGYFNEFKNDNLFVNTLNDKSINNLTNVSNNKKELIKNLVDNNFKYDSELNYYYLNDNNIKYSYFVENNTIRIDSNDGNKFSLNVYLNDLNFKITFYDSNVVGSVIDLSYYNRSDKNYAIFEKYYNQYLSKYFKDFIEV